MLAELRQQIVLAWRTCTSQATCSSYVTAGNTGRYRWGLAHMCTHCGSNLAVKFNNDNDRRHRHISIQFVFKHASKIIHKNVFRAYNKVVKTKKHLFHLWLALQTETLCHTANDALTMTCLLQSCVISRNCNTGKKCVYVHLCSSRWLEALVWHLVLSLS